MQPALLDLLVNRQGTAERAVSSDREEQRDALPLQEVDDFPRVLLAP